MERLKVSGNEKEKEIELSRRQLFDIVLGAGAVSLVGCDSLQHSFAGELRSPNHSFGHQLRDGWTPELGVDGFEEKSVVIVGGGIAGLSAAWQLARAGIKDFVLLEMEPVLGGTSQSGTQDSFACPWGAHYLPVPMKENEDLVELLEEMDVVIGRNEEGDPVVDERYLCREPEERVYADSRWTHGLFPSLNASDRDFEQLERFREIIDEWVQRRDEQGRRMFAIPVAHGSDCDEVKELDQQSMAEWMDRNGFRSERLRWLVDYSCRDDYGLSLAQTSAWAGLFYFASRQRRAGAQSQEVITWPEGNGKIVNYLASQVSKHLRSSNAVYKIRSMTNGQVEVNAWDLIRKTCIGIRAEQVIFAAPRFLAPRLIDGFDPGAATEFHYGPWVVANITLRERPKEKHGMMCWDNVTYGSKSLGYVNSAHQLGRDYGPTVITWYYALSPLLDSDADSVFGGEGTLRQKLLHLTWSDWAELIVTDLQKAHPDIRSLISRIDVMRWGHAMIEPRTGFVWSTQRVESTRPIGGIHFANTDLSGVALMEEAFYHGIRAAKEILSDQLKAVKAT